MNVLEEGVNPLFMDPDPDKARQFFATKSRAMTDKRMTEKEDILNYTMVTVGNKLETFLPQRSCTAAVVE